LRLKRCSEFFEFDRSRDQRFPESQGHSLGRLRAGSAQPGDAPSPHRQAIPPVTASLFPRSNRGSFVAGHSSPPA